jgi:hypothetical protein
MNKLAKQQNSVGTTIKSNQLSNVSPSEVLIYNANVSSKKFKNYSTEKELLIMNALITKWAKYIGVKQPEAIELNTIANFIKESFPNFNEVDLKELIVLLVNGKLDTDAEAYGSLSVIYCSKVLRSYQEYKFKILFKVREEIQKIENKKPLVIDKETRLKNFKELLIQAKESATKDLYHDTGDILFHFINHNNLFPITKEIKTEASLYSNEKYNAENKKKVYEAVIKNISFKSIEQLNYDKEQKKRFYAREHYVNTWLKKVDLSKLLQKIKYEWIDF